MTRKYLAFIILIGFLALSTFSLLGMGHADGHGSSDCIAVNAGVFDCSEGQSPVDFVASHLEVFKGFSQAAFSGSMILLLYFFVLMLFVGRDVLGGIDRLHVIPSGVGSPDFLSPQIEGMVRWLSIHENSPSF